MIVLDFETTGLAGAADLPLDKQPRIIEATLAQVDDKTLREVNRFTTMIDPGIPLSQEVREITGIRDEELKGAGTFGQHYPEFIQMFLGQVIMVAHNCAFEGLLMEYELTRINKQFYFPWTRRRICTVEASQHFKKRRLRLGELYLMATGKKIVGAHRTDADVTALIVCLRWLKKNKHIEL